MEGNASFGEILEEADRLPMEDQQTLIEILQRRMRDRRRAELARDIQEAQKEFQDGVCRPASADELMREILLP